MRKKTIIQVTGTVIDLAISESFDAAIVDDETGVNVTLERLLDWAAIPAGAHITITIEE